MSLRAWVAAAAALVTVVMTGGPASALPVPTVPADVLEVFAGEGPRQAQAGAAGTLVRVETTGGGGWGDPLEREPELVGLDVLQGKVSERAARDDYGVVVRIVDDATFEVDAGATSALRAELRAARSPRPFFDRGPGYRLLSGRDHADVDHVNVGESDRRSSPTPPTGSG